MRELIESVHQKAVAQAGQLDRIDPSLAKVIVDSGKQDGDPDDDRVAVKRASWSATSLKPSQSTMVLEKALGMAIGMLESGKIGGDLGAIVSSDNHIMDGHHRWAATILASGSKGKVGGFAAALDGKKLQPVLNLLTKGQFMVGRGKKGSGAISEFTPKNVSGMLETFVDKGIGGKFPKSPEQVRKVLADAFGSPEAGIKQMAKNVTLMNKSVPGWAPAREQMPVIEPEQVPVAAKKLKGGDVDHSAPYKESEGSMRDLIEKKMAKAIDEGVLGGGIPISWVIGVLDKIVGKDQFGKVVKKGKGIKISTQVDGGMGDGQKLFDRFVEKVQEKYPDANVGHESSGKVWTIHLP